MYKKKIALSILASSILVAQDIKLEEITVTSASRVEQSVDEVTANVNVITAKEIEEKHYTTVTQALNSIAGVSFTSTGGLGQSTSVYLRGVSSKRTLVMIDGIRYNDVTGINGAPYGNLMIGDIQQIEVIKGAQSGVWGADASAGVINIITKGAQKGMHASLNAEYGSFATKKLGMSASYKTDDYYMKASGQKINTDGFTSQAPKGKNIDNYEDDQYENKTGKIKLGFNINDKNKVDISHTIIHSKTDYDGYDAFYQPDPDSSDYTNTHNSFSQINFNNKNSFTEVDIYAKLSKFDRDYPSLNMEFDGSIREYGIKTDTPYNDEDFFVLGVDYKNFEHENGLNEEYDNKAVFITNSNQFNTGLGKTIFSQSLRFDAYDKFDDETTGKIGVKHFFSQVSGLSTSANFGTSYNVPTLSNLYNPYYGNENLDPESTSTYDFGIGYKDLKVTYFNTVIDDMIDYSFNTYHYYNTDGTTKIQGIEIEYNTYITEDLALNSSYTWLDADNSENETLARRPKDTYKLALDYYGIEDLHLGVFGEYVGERYDSDDEQGVQTGKYTVVNLVADYQVTKELSVYTKVDNLFDKTYQVVDGYASAPLSAYVGMNAKF